jgi:5-amino-6-(5-phosphoribosylamino)uracil reductase
MADRPYTLLSCSMSIDGYLDSATVKRLPLSNSADFDRVDEVRASCDAILVGAATVRNDNPRLLIRSADRRDERIARGRPGSPVKVTVTASGTLEAGADFFQAGDGAKIVYCPSTVRPDVDERLGDLATVVDSGHCVDMLALCEDLHTRGVDRLMVEGGGTVITQFLAADLADELQLVVAPFFVGDSRAHRLVSDERFPWTASRRAPLAGVRQIGDVALLTYALSSRYAAQ